MTIIIKRKAACDSQESRVFGSQFGNSTFYYGIFYELREGGR